jgi:hypothetical protein
MYRNANRSSTNILLFGAAPAMNCRLITKARSSRTSVGRQLAEPTGAISLRFQPLAVKNCKPAPASLWLVGVIIATFHRASVLVDLELYDLLLRLRWRSREDKWGEHWVVSGRFLVGAHGRRRGLCRQ